jgi:hypothetical protein
MGQVKELYSAENAINEMAFDLTMQILESGKRDVLKELTLLRGKADEYAEAVVSVMNFRSPLEREICKDCAKAGFLMSVEESIKLCSEILRPDYVGRSKAYT